MKLLLDIGNTRIAWALVDGDRLGPRKAHQHRGVPLQDALTFLAQLPAPPTAAVAVNVAGAELGEAVAAALRSRFGIALQQVTATRAACGVTNGYADPRQLGADRWAAVVGAWQRWRRDLVVIDAGTALTVDLVRADGHHLGGLIVPGVALMQAALAGSTADIAALAASEAAEGAAAASDPALAHDLNLGRSTRDAIAHGAVYSLLALIERAQRAFPEPAAGAPTLVLTGGDAAQLHQHAVLTAAELRPALVLEGLQRLTDAAD